MASIVSVENVSQRFGGLLALSDVSFAVETGEIKSIIGPNGAGKTTLFNVLTGVTPLQTGRIGFRGQDVGGLPAHSRVRLGMARTFQNPQIFSEMTLLENVIVGRHVRSRSGFLGGWFDTPASRREKRRDRDFALHLLEQMGLSERAAVPVRALSYGETKIMEIARAMASEPELLLLDEPMAGLRSDSVALVSELIASLNARGITIVLVEHNVRVVMGLSHSVLVLNNGQRIAEGSPHDVRHDPVVIDAYLGEGSHAA